MGIAKLLGRIELEAGSESDLSNIIIVGRDFKFTVDQTVQLDLELPAWVQLWIWDGANARKLVIKRKTILLIILGGRNGDIGLFIGVIEGWLSDEIHVDILINGLGDGDLEVFELLSFQVNFNNVVGLELCDLLGKGDNQQKEEEGQRMDGARHASKYLYMIGFV